MPNAVDSKRLSREFYARDAKTVAQELLGKLIVHRCRGKNLSARIVETEAYIGEHDLACHSSKGRTKRTEVMFGPAGHAYVYFIYGVHDMFNVVTGSENCGEAVLIRAAESESFSARALAGPGKLTRGLKITRALNGADLCGNRIFILNGKAPRKIVKAKRIGVDYAGKWKDAHLRFYDGESAAVSRLKS